MRMEDGRVVPNFINQALNNKPLTVYGNGHQTRSFCYYSDLIEGIYRLLKSNETFPVNIGNPSEFTILQFAKLVLEYSGAKSKIIYKPLPIDDPKQRRPDIARAKKYLKWTPGVELEQGLKETIAWFSNKKNLK
jgi:dTDP-glucose 4,6-dehydratase